MLPDRKQIHLKNFDYANKDYPYFVTICCHDNKSRFDNALLANKVIESICFLQDSGKAVVYCYCVMPDHLHMVLSLGEFFGKDLGDLVAYFKRFTSKIAKDGFAVDKLWQKNYYEHVVRNNKNLSEICEYILDNPVRKGIVAGREDYPYSKIMTPPPIL